MIAEQLLQRIMKNNSQKSKRQPNSFSPYKTQNFRFKEYRKPNITLVKQLHEQINKVSKNQQTNKSVQKNQKTQEVVKKEEKQQIRINTPSLFRKSVAYQPRQTFLYKNHNSQNPSAYQKSSYQKGSDQKISYQKKTIEPNIKTNDKYKANYEQIQQRKPRQSNNIFRKTFCTSFTRKERSSSTNEKSIQKRPPSSQIQTYRPSTRIRKISNIGQQSNSNFLAKYQIIKELGKGTYGVVYLAKIIPDKKRIQNQSFLKATIFSSRIMQKNQDLSKSSVQTKQIIFQQFNASLGLNDLGNSKQNMLTLQTVIQKDKNNCDDQTIQKIEIQVQSIIQISKQNLENTQNIIDNFKEDLNKKDESNEQKTIRLKEQINPQKSQQQQNCRDEKKQTGYQKGQQTENLNIQFNEGSHSPEKVCQKIDIFDLKDSIIDQGYKKQEQQQFVAIKVYEKFKMNKDPAKFKNIRKQITIMQNLSHEGVIKLYESVQSLTKISLVVQFGGQQSLLDHLRKNFPLSQQKLKNFSKQLLNIIIYLHQKNIVHRDIKPQNILIKTNSDTKQEQLKLIDYGFSTLTNKSRKLNAICGTPNFMAPQLLSSKQYFGEKADTWSYGIVVFVMAEGRHPFKSTQYKELQRLVNKGKYSFKRKHQLKFENFIGQILKVNSSQRPTASQISKFKWLQQQ